MDNLVKRIEVLNNVVIDLAGRLDAVLNKEAKNPTERKEAPNPGQPCGMSVYLQDRIDQIDKTIVFIQSLIQDLEI
jgi:hypothetical protein